MRWTLESLTVVALLVSACGTTHTLTATNTSEPSATGSATTVTSATATPTLAPAPPCATSAQPAPPSTLAGTIAIERYHQPSDPNAEWDLDVITTQGTVISHTTLNSSNPQPVGVGAHGVYIYDGTAGKMERLEANGVVRFLNSAPVSEGGVTSAAESPDGACWVYSVEREETMGGDVTSKIFVGTLGASPRLVATFTRPDGGPTGYRGGYRVLRWDAAGVLLGTDPHNVGGAGPFIRDDYYLASAVRLDPAAGKVLSVICGAQGGFGDVAADGTEACRSGNNVIVVHPDGSITTATNSQKTGQVAFVAGSSTLTYCTTTGLLASTPTRPSNWRNTLYAATPTGAQATERRLVTDDQPFCDIDFAFTKVVDGNTLAELSGLPGQASLVLVNLITGQVTPVAPAIEVVGVL
jgi:hypothetical protein